MSETLAIGNWSFEPETGVLSRPGESQRLESRTAALLELLCRHRGELVSHSDIIEKVWDGRSVSPNSVAVVISDIRRSLGDDPRAPQYVETLPKRGYRLIAQGAALEEAHAHIAEPRAGSVRARVPARVLILAGALAVAAILTGLIRVQDGGQPGLKVTRIAVAGIENETGNEEYAALTTATSELLTLELMHQETLHVLPEKQVGIVVSGTLILWDGHPAISLRASSTGDGQILWSGMAVGPEPNLPEQVHQQIALLAEAAREKDLLSASLDQSGG